MSGDYSDEELGGKVHDVVERYAQGDTSVPLTRLLVRQKLEQELGLDTGALRNRRAVINAALEQAIEEAREDLETITLPQASPMKKTSFSDLLPSIGREDVLVEEFSVAFTHSATTGVSVLEGILTGVVGMGLFVATCFMPGLLVVPCMLLALACGVAFSSKHLWGALAVWPFVFSFVPGFLLVMIGQFPLMLPLSLLADDMPAVPWVLLLTAFVVPMYTVEEMVKVAVITGDFKLWQHPVPSLSSHSTNANPFALVVRGFWSSFGLSLVQVWILSLIFGAEFYYHHSFVLGWMFLLELGLAMCLPSVLSGLLISFSLTDTQSSWRNSGAWNKRRVFHCASCALVRGVIVSAFFWCSLVNLHFYRWEPRALYLSWWFVLFVMVEAVVLCPTLLSWTWQRWRRLARVVAVDVEKGTQHASPTSSADGSTNTHSGGDDVDVEVFE